MCEPLIPHILPDIRLDAAGEGRAVGANELDYGAFKLRWCFAQHLCEATSGGCLSDIHKVVLV